MADAKDKIVMHGGGIVTVGGKIIMGPCDPVEYYVRLMVGDVAMEDWWRDLLDFGRTEWSKWASSGYGNPIAYFEQADVADADLGQIKGERYDFDDATHSLHWQIGDSYLDKAVGIYCFGAADDGWPEAGLYWNGAYQFYYDQDAKEYYPRFTSRSRGANAPAGYLDNGTFVVSVHVFGEYMYHFESHSTWPHAPHLDRHVVTEVTSSRVDRALYKFIVSDAEMGKGLGGSNKNVEIVGYGDWSKELRETNVGAITSMTFAPTIEIVRVKRSKDGNPVEEVVWQSR